MVIFLGFIRILLAASGAAATCTSASAGTSTGASSVTAPYTRRPATMLGVVLIAFLYVMTVRSSVDVHGMTVAADKSSSPMVGDDGIHTEYLKDEENDYYHNQKHRNGCLIILKLVIDHSVIKGSVLCCGGIEGVIFHLHHAVFARIH